MPDRVYRRTAPPYPFGAVPRDFPRSYLVYTGLDPLNLGSHEGKGYLLVASPFDASLFVERLAPPYPFGAVPRVSPRSYRTKGRAVAIYPAATGNAARSSANDDTPAGQYVPAKLNGRFNYEISIFGGVDPTEGGTSTVGVIELIDPDGELDYLLDLSWDNAVIELKRGDPEAYFNTYETVAALTAAGIRATVRKKEILTRGLDWRLQGELHGERYKCTGGLDGDPTITSLKNRIKPIAFGPVFNISPVLINATSLIYQVSLTSVLAIDEVRDGGVPLTADSDYPTYEALDAVTPASGHYATCTAFGLFKLGATSVFPITADVRGDNDTINSFSYPHTRAQIARRIAAGRGVIRLRDPSDLDVGTFSYLDTWQTANVGRFWDQEITKAAALTELMAGCAGWWTVRLDGRLAVGQIEDPALVSALFTLDYAPTTSESRVDPASMPEDLPPRRNTLMGWRRNYTVMQPNEIAGSVSQANREIYQSEGSFTTSENLWVASGYPNSPVVTIDGGFDTDLAAQAEGDRESRLFGQVRRAYSVPVVMDQFADVAGRVGRIANFNRLGLGAAANGFCFGVAVNANSKPILKLWK